MKRRRVGKGRNRGYEKRKRRRQREADRGVKRRETGE